VSAYLAVDQRLPQYPTRDAALLWDEQHGWCLAVESHSTEDLLVQAYLGVDIVPAPRVVADFAARLIRGERPGQPDPPHLRTLDAHDDLPQRLAAYATVDDARPPPPPAATGTPAKTAPAQPEPVPDIHAPLTVHLEHHGQGVVLHVGGDLDMVTAPHLQESITHALTQPLELLILDLTGVRFLGSAGLAVLINAHDHAQHHTPIPVRVVAASRAVTRPLDALGLVTMMAIYPTVPDALADPLTSAHLPPAARARPAG
jgi:anti-anti-sigma factor